MKEQNELVTIQEYNSIVDAHIARDILENAGIPSMLTNETISSIYPLPYTSLGSIKLHVFQRDAEIAINTLNDIETNSELEQYE